MITETLIAAIKNDSSIRTLVGASSANSTPVQAGFVRGEITDYLIAVDAVMGETEEVGGYEHGIITIEIYVKASINAPLTKVTNIAKRIVAIMDLKGSQLNDAYTTAVYRLRKTSFSPDFDEASQSHMGVLDFEFYTTRTA